MSTDTPTETASLRLLIVEDSVIEAKFTSNLLKKKGGYTVISKRVETAEDMTAALESDEWDLIISDYQMPEFDGSRALEIYQSFNLDIPFILVSGKIGEEAAVDLMKRGAHDYIMKGNTARLLPAIKSQLKEAANREERRGLESKLRESEAQYRGFFENAAIGIFRCNAAAEIVDLNNRLAHYLGFETREQCIEVSKVLVPEFYDETNQTAHTIDLAEQTKENGHFEAIFHRQDGSVMEAVLNVWAIEDGESFYLEGTIEDVTEQRETERKLREMEELHDNLIDITSSL